LTVIVIIVALCVGGRAARALPPTSTWTKGHKKILVIPVRFTDAPGPTDSDV